MKDKHFCNCCGRKLKTKEGSLREDALFVEKEWGYFSQKDLELHSFYICEECYDRWIQSFSLPIEKRKVTEVV